MKRLSKVLSIVAIVLITGVFNNTSAQTTGTYYLTIDEVVTTCYYDDTGKVVTSAYFAGSYSYSSNLPYPINKIEVSYAPIGGNSSSWQEVTCTLDPTTGKWSSATTYDTVSPGTQYKAYAEGYHFYQRDSIYGYPLYSTNFLISSLAAYFTTASPPSPGQHINYTTSFVSNPK